MRPCSRSATASARRASAASSSSRTPSTGRRSAASTCARSRTSASSCCPRTPTSRASSARTPTTSASTASSTSTSTTRASSSARRTRRVGARRVPAARARRSDRRESNIVLLALAAIALVTALVIVAWRFGGPENAPVHGFDDGDEAAAAGGDPAGGRHGAARAARHARRLLPARPQGQRPRGDPLPGHARARPEAALRRPGALGAARVAEERARAPNGNRVRLPAAVKAQGVFVTAKKIFAADAA